MTLVDELHGQTADTGNFFLINQHQCLSGLIELAQLAVKLYRQAFRIRNSKASGVIPSISRRAFMNVGRSL